MRNLLIWLFLSSAAIAQTYDYKRPTTDADPGSAACSNGTYIASASMSGVYSGKSGAGPVTSTPGVLTSSSNTSGSSNGSARVFSVWQSTAYRYSASTLYMDIACSISHSGGCLVQASQNGGTSWTTILNRGTPYGTTVYALSLSPSSALSGVQVRACATSDYTTTVGSASITIYDIWTTGLVAPSISRVIWWDGAGAGGGGVGASNYVFSQYAYGPESSGPVNVTSNTVTVTQGDFAVQWCRENSAFPGGILANDSANDPVVSSPPNQVSWGSGPYAAQMFYYPILTGGSQTFTCSTSGILDSGFSTTVLIYHHTGSTPTLMSYTPGSCASGTGCTSGSTAVTGPALVVYCATQNTTAAVFTAGSVGASSGTLRGVSNSSLTTASDAGCEDASFVSAQGSVTASMTSNTAAEWGYTIAAFQ